MSNDLNVLRDTLRKIFPDSKIEPLSESDLTVLRAAYPGLPEHYCTFLREVGWGSIGDGGFMIYSGPFEPTEFFDEATSADLAEIVLIGDDFSGWMIGFDTSQKWVLVGIDSCSPTSEPLNLDTLAEFFWQRIADNTNA